MEEIRWKTPVNKWSVCWPILCLVRFPLMLRPRCNSMLGNAQRAIAS